MQRLLKAMARTPDRKGRIKLLDEEIRQVKRNLAAYRASYEKLVKIKNRTQGQSDAFVEALNGLNREGPYLETVEAWRHSLMEGTRGQ